MENKDLEEVLKYIGVRSVFLNIAVYLVSVIFLGFTLPIAVGLVIGTLGMLINLFLLGRSVSGIIRSRGRKGNTKMFLGYLLRATVTVAIVATASFFGIPCMVGAALPVLYPRLVYGGRTLFRKEE